VLIKLENFTNFYLKLQSVTLVPLMTMVNNLNNFIIIIVNNLVIQNEGHLFHYY